MKDKEWTFKTFITDNGSDAFEDWIEGLGDADAEERIRGMIKRLSNMAIWGRPYFDILHGSKQIHEIRVKAKNKEYRPLGCFGPGPQVFTILVGASKKGKIWDPPSAIETAEKRRKLVYEDGRLHVYQPRERHTKTTTSE